MNRLFFYPLAGALILSTLWAFDDLVQYWGAHTAVGVVQAVERRGQQVGDNIGYSFATYTTISWSEEGLDRRADVRYRLNKTGSNRPYVGMKVPIVYVKSRPHRVRLESTHRGYRLLWIPLSLAWLFAWLAWRGKIPDYFYERRSGRDEIPREDKRWRGDAWLTWHGKNSRSPRQK
jgi:hypothetical protein